MVKICWQINYQDFPLVGIKRLHRSSLIKGIFSEINDTEELPEVIFLIILKLIDQYQLKNPILLAEYTMVMYQNVSFCGGSNIYLNLITCEDKIVILSILQICVLNGTICISFVQEWIERRQLLFKICTGPAL